MQILALALAAMVAASGSVAFGQLQTQGMVTYSLSKQIVQPGLGGNWQNPTFVPDLNVNPGEGVLFKVVIQMSVAPGAATLSNGGSLGGPLTWAPSIQGGSSGTGTSVGFWSGDLNLTGDGGASSAAGAWSDGTANFALSVRRRLSIATAGNGIGAVNGNGSGLTDIQPAQFTGDADGVSHLNNFVTFQALWIPSDYSERDVAFALSLGSLGLPSMVAAADQNYDNGYVLPVALTSATSSGQSLTLHVVPGPAGALVLAGGAFASRRRRVRSCR